MNRYAWIVLAVAMGLAASSSTVRAQESATPSPQETGDAHDQNPHDEEGRRLFEAGALAFSDGRYEDALSRFAEAYALSQRPELLFNIGAAAERLRRDREAIEAYEAFLKARPESPRARQVQSRIEILKSLQAERADDSVVNAAPTTDVESATENTESNGSGRRTGLVLSFGAAGAGLVAFGVLGGLALSERRTLDKGCGATVSCDDDDVSRLRGLSLGADIGLGVAAAGAVAGLLVLLLVDSSDEASTRTALMPHVVTQGAGLSFRSRF